MALRLRSLLCGRTWRTKPAASYVLPFRQASSKHAGALIYDKVFCHVFSKSDDALKGLIWAWASSFGLIDCSEKDLVLTVLSNEVKSNIPMQDFGGLFVDLRCSNGKMHYIVEVQHFAEASFAARALLYTASGLLDQYNTLLKANKAQGLGIRSSKIAGDVLPVHTLAFCDYGFLRKKDGTLSVTDSKWRANEQHEASPQEQLLQVFRLLPDMDTYTQALPGISQPSASLQQYMKERLSISFCILPRAPPLEELTADTPPLAKWASVVANLGPDNAGSLPPAVAQEPGIAAIVKSFQTPETRQILTLEEDVANKVAITTDATIAEKDATIAEKDATIAEKDAALAEKDAALAENYAKIESLLKKLQEQQPVDPNTPGQK